MTGHQTHGQWSCATAVFHSSGRLLGVDVGESTSDGAAADLTVVTNPFAPSDATFGRPPVVYAGNGRPPDWTTPAEAQRRVSKALGQGR